MNEVVLVPLACEDESSFALLSSTFNLSCSFPASMANGDSFSNLFLLTFASLPSTMARMCTHTSLECDTGSEDNDVVPGQTELLALLLLSFH